MYLTIYDLQQGKLLLKLVDQALRRRVSRKRSERLLRRLKAVLQLSCSIGRFSQTRAPVSPAPSCRLRTTRMEDDSAVEVRLVQVRRVAHGRLVVQVGLVEIALAML
jgi:hypothetical protein